MGPWRIKALTCTGNDLTTIVVLAMTNELHYGERLRAARMRVGITSQRQLAAKTGLDKKTISRHERSKKPPDPTDRVIAALAQAVGLTEHELLSGKSSPMPNGHDGTKDPIAAVYRYCAEQADRGSPVNERTLKCMLALPWTTIASQGPTAHQIHTMRQTLDALMGV